MDPPASLTPAGGFDTTALAEIRARDDPEELAMLDFYLQVNLTLKCLK
jgi:hypothetical protein